MKTKQEPDFIGKNKVKQSLVWCTPMKTHLQKCSPLGISSGYSLARPPMMGLHCCVPTHCAVKDSAFNLWGMLQCPGSLGDPKEGDGLCSGHLQSMSAGTGPLRGTDPHLWQQEDLGSAFCRAAPGEPWHSEYHTQQHARGLRVRKSGGWKCPSMRQGTLAWGY